LPYSFFWGWHPQRHLCHSFFPEGFFGLFLSNPCFGEGPKKRVGRDAAFCGFAVMVAYPALGNRQYCNGRTDNI